VNDLLVLCYHAVSPRWQMPYALTPSALRAQVARLLRAGYEPVTVSEALGAPAAAGGRRLAVTFDDALVSVVAEALPVLDALGVPATVFACTDWVGRDAPMRIGYDRWLGTPHEAQLHSLGWDELAALRDRGWEIGSHTCTHPRLTQLDDDALSRELVDSRRAVEQHLGGPCRALAYPHGDCDARVVAAAGSAGYDVALTARAGTGAADPLRVPRAVVLRDDGRARIALKTSVAARRLRGSDRAWRVLASGYRAVGGGRGHRGAA
jgi:peptidoglycan/xylan/chitin deacetylase (PgdA/CDA1 family)